MKKLPENSRIYFFVKKVPLRGTWVAQLVEYLNWAQVMISQFVSSSLALGCVLTAQSLEPASNSVSPSLSAQIGRASCRERVCLYV